MGTSLKISGVMTTGRYCNSWAIDRIYAAFTRAGIPLNRQGGVFYGQCMQKLLEGQIERGVDLVVTVDGDSVFTSDDLMRLIENAAADDSIDALASLQSRRGIGAPLLNPLGDHEPGKIVEVRFEGKPLQVKTAHFGLTAIKLDRLRDVPKPWFQGQAGEDGTWGDGRIDDDIWFWKQWQKAGRTLFVDSSVSIGHVEEMVSMFDCNGQHKQVYLNDWDAEYLNKKQKEKTLVWVGPNCTSDIEDVASNFSKRIFFEPLPTAANILREAYPTDTVVEAACGAECGEGTLNCYNQHGVSSSLFEVSEEAKETFTRVDWSDTATLNVQILNLGNWLESNDVNEVDFLIIDAQGMDFEILKTLEPQLREKKIKRLQTEYDNQFQHYQGVDNSFESQRKFLNQFGYDCDDSNLAFHGDIIWEPISESDTNEDLAGSACGACATA